MKRRDAATVIVLAMIAVGSLHAAWDPDKKADEIMKRVAEFSKCKSEVGASNDPGRRAELRERLGKLRQELDRDNIDYRTFIGKRGETEDIFGDWFIDGSWFANSIYRDFLRVIDPRRMARRLVHLPKQAKDVTRDGGVPDSAFFINTDIASITPAELVEADTLVKPHGKLTITGKKGEGKSEGFLAKDERGWDYICIIDPPMMQEQETSAEVVGGTLVRMAGYYVPLSAIVTIEGTGNPEFDGKRGVVTRLVEGYKGHWSYHAFKDRREIRATKVFGAWIHNTDWVDHNTGISVVEVEGVPLTRYYIFDFGGSLGSWNVRTKEPRDGWEHYVDFGEFFSWPVKRPLRLLGVIRRPYQEKYATYSEAVGFFDSNVSALRYRANYPNMAWMAMTREDGLWAARLLASYSEEQIRTVIDLASYTRKEDSDYIFRTLLERRTKILREFGLAPGGNNELQGEGQGSR